MGERHTALEPLRSEEPVESLWCEGLAHIGRRALTEAEAKDAAGALAHESRRLRRTDRLVVVTFAGLLVAATLGLVWTSEGPIEPGTFSCFAPATALAGLGVLGALLEIVAAPSRLSRALFGAAMLIAAMSHWLASVGQRSRALDIATAISTGVVVIGGVIVLALRWSDRRKRLVLVRGASKDVTGGEVDAFGAVDRLVEVLPASCVVYRVDDSVVLDRMYAADVRRVPVPRDAPEGAWYEGRGRTLPPGVRVTQRHLVVEELEELAGYKRRALRAALVRSLVTLVCVAGMLRGLEQLTSGRQRLGPSALALSFAIAVAAVVLVRGYLWSRRLAGDIARGVTLVVRSAPRDDGKSDEDLVEEVLPVSGLQWTLDGAPSLGRGRRPPS